MILRHAWKQTEHANILKYISYCSAVVSFPTRFFADMTFYPSAYQILMEKSHIIRIYIFSRHPSVCLSDIFVPHVTTICCNLLHFGIYKVVCEMKIITISTNFSLYYLALYRIPVFPAANLKWLSVVKFVISRKSLF